MIIVYSSNGEFQINEDGIIKERESNDIESDFFIFSVRKFDLEEWKKTYSTNIPSSLDILDLGYWYSGIEHDESTWEYEEPAFDWRKEFRN